MNKTAIKNFAIQSRKDLILGVSQKAFELGITKDKIESNTITSSDAFVVHSKVLSRSQQKQRDDLLYQIKHKGYDQVIEEAAYTWFNRFIALRYMEVNGYLPSKIRVFSNHENKFKPEILDQALHVSFEGVQKEKVIEYLDKSDDEGLYQYLLIAQCNDMNQYLPEMFEKIGNYTEILLPDGLLKSSGVLANMVESIAEEDFQDQVEIIGWLYQYYNSEVKDETYRLMKKNVKVSKERIPSVTQLFTPDWIVRYMVENSLGRLWIEGHSQSKLRTNWKYYLEEAQQEEEVVKQLEAIRAEYQKLKPIDIKVIDPAMGSGHILVYAFEVLMQIYVSEGYTERDAAKQILMHNLYGLDIDDRAYQLSYFALMMKARKYNRRVLEESLELNICSIQESNPIPLRLIELISTNDKEVYEQLEYLYQTFKDAKEYGSILNVKSFDYPRINELINHFEQSVNDNLFDMEAYDVYLPLLKKVVKQAVLLSIQYDVVITNPPYMGSGMNAKLSNYVKKHYPTSKSDLFAVFMEKCNYLTKSLRYQAMITMHSWMFLSGFEKLRKTIIETQQTINMAHLGARAFDEIGGEVVQATTFVLMKKKPILEYQSIFVRLVDFKSEAKKEEAYFKKENRYFSKQDNFNKIPGSPIAYWVSENVSNTFRNSELLGNIASPKQGLATTDNNRFVRIWQEVILSNIKFNHNKHINDGFNVKWFPFNKGGEYRKWYGNNHFVVNYLNDGAEIKENVLRKYTYLKTPDFVVKNQEYYFLENGSWSAISSGNISVRYSPIGFIISNAGMAIFSNSSLKYIIALMNSKCVSHSFIGVVNQTLNFNAGDIEKIPFVLDETRFEEINNLSNFCIIISKTDWDSFETSWDFDKHPLLKHYDDNTSTEQLISNSYNSWKEFTNQQFLKLKDNEEELNRIFIDIYGLQDELTPEVEDKDITIHRIFDEKQDVLSAMKGSKYILLKEDVIKSFISYAIGCLFGRYSLDYDGLAYAGGDWDESKYQTIIPDDDNIIPISEEAYLEDDLLVRFITFIETVYGSETLEENLEFIASAISSKGNSSREVIREYLLNDFYKDHIKTYQKRPIYWLFDSGKNNGFKALIYMHRYNKDLLAKMRLDYVHELQERYRSERSHITRIVDDVDNQRDKVTYNKQLEKLKAKEEELLRYEEKLHHLADQRIEIDLDDGVVVNYAKFEDLVAKIK